MYQLYNFFGLGYLIRRKKKTLSKCYAKKENLCVFNWAAVFEREEKIEYALRIYRRRSTVVDKDRGL